MHTIGIDIGGTHLRCAEFSEEYEIITMMKIPNETSLSAEANMDKLIDFILARKDQCGGIGIGCPGPLDFSAGKVLNPPNLYGWNNFELVKYVEGKTGLRTVLNNDANMAGLAEAVLGAGRGFQSVFYITISTGIGGAYVYRGELINGAHSSAGEAYNLIVCDDPHPGGGANPASINEICGGKALFRQTWAVYNRCVDTRELYDELYRKKREPPAVKIIERCIDTMARAVGNIACIVDPDLFIVGGSIALRSEGYLTMLEEKARSYMIDPSYLRIEKARLGDNAGLMGAAILISEKSP
ncbi:MAG: ROK family protein [Spirochaetaceae bacterium]|jgi:glucokinase|nr:ROK family protein [Spirochaetaceae bacterium]